MSRRFRERQGAKRVQERGEEGRGRKRWRERPASEGALDVTAPRRPTRRHAVRGSPVPLPPGMHVCMHACIHVCILHSRRYRFE